MGMITTNVLEESLSFGPLPTSLMIAEPAYLIAQTTTDRLSELPTIYADPKRLSDPIRLIEWVCNLRCARCPGEQNMELVYCHQLGQSFYRTIRRIEVGEELLVWFRRQDLQPLVTEYLSNLHISEAWIGQTVKSTNVLQKDYEEFVNVHKSLNTDYYKFQCSKCHEEFTYIYPYISHCLFKCHKQTIIQNTQWINHHQLMESNEFPIELTNKCTYQQNIDLLLRNNMNTQLNPNKLDHIKDNTIEDHDDVDDVDDDDGDDDSQLTIETRSNKIGDPFQKIGNTNELTSIKNFNSLHRKYLHKIQSNNKMSKNLKILKQTTYIDNISSLYNKKSKLKTTLLPLKSRNPLVEQLLQTIMFKKIDTNIENNSTLSIKKSISSSPTTTTTTMMTTTTTTASSPLLCSLSLAQNWCARCFITFRLTSDLVHHMRTCHNQANKHSNYKDRLLSHHKTIDLINKKKQLNNEMDSIHSNGQSSLSSLSSLTTNGTLTTSLQTSTMSTTTTTTTTATALSCYSTINKPICSLCGEQFKEKHHLTRHMLSHK
ncbi:unnamed protein product [Schistosoma rodhaini]|nr:unnamed protein product [Schistosoma rodhaini]